MGDTISKILDAALRNMHPVERSRIAAEIRGAKAESISAAVENTQAVTNLLALASGTVRRLGLSVDATGHCSESEFRAALTGQSPIQKMALRSLLSQAGFLPL
jgi:hypothetical protein